MAEEQNIISYVERRAKQAEDHPDWKPALGDILYMTHGSGSDRDRFFALSEIAELIAANMNPIELEASGGGEHYKLTITHNSITCVKTAGDLTTTYKVDFFDESALGDVKTENFKAKKISGTTPVSASVYKLVIDTATELLGNLVVGSANDKKDVTIHGNVDIDGKFVSDVTVGVPGNTPQETVPADLRVVGNSTVDGEMYIKSGSKLHANEIAPITGGAPLKLDSDVDLEGVTNVKGHVSLGGIVVDCTSDTGTISVESKCAGYTQDNTVVILYCKTGQTLSLLGGASITIAGPWAALPFFIKTGAENRTVAVPMFVAEWA